MAVKIFSDEMHYLTTTYVRHTSTRITGKVLSVRETWYTEQRHRWCVKMLTVLWSDGTTSSVPETDTTAYFPGARYTH